MCLLFLRDECLSQLWFILLCLLQFIMQIMILIVLLSDYDYVFELSVLSPSWLLFLNSVLVPWSA